MKKYFGAVCWLIGAILWIFMAFSAYSKGQISLAGIQVLIVILFLINAFKDFKKHKK